MAYDKGYSGINPKLVAALLATGVYNKFKYKPISGPQPKRIGPPTVSYIPQDGETDVLKKKGAWKKKRSFQSKLLKNVHAQHLILDDVNFFTQNQTHNTIYTANITNKITQGTGNQNRIGDSIYLCAAKIQGTIVTPTASGNYMYRIIVGFSGEEYNPTPMLGISYFGSGLTTSELFLGAPTVVMPNAIINPKAFTVLCDYKFTIDSVLSANSNTKAVDVSVPIEQKFLYQAGTVGMGKYKNLYVVVIGWVKGGVTGTTNCGDFTGAFDLVFKNV